MTTPTASSRAGGAHGGGRWRRKKAGKVRFIGFTGHKGPDIHLHMLETADAHGFRFDTVQMPLNVMDAHFDSFEKSVLPVPGAATEIGVLGMKPMGRQLSPREQRRSRRSSACTTR